MSSTVGVEVPPNDRAELEGWLRSPSLRAGLAQRPRIVLCCGSQQTCFMTVSGYSGGRLAGDGVTDTATDLSPALTLLESTGGIGRSSAKQNVARR